MVLLGQGGGRLLEQRSRGPPRFPGGPLRVPDGREAGPRLLVEWDNTQRGANHAHSVRRDPVADFGLDVLARHHAPAHR
ncbi:DUF3500 domain-containing protein [Blastococcus sp. KM273128]|uniref:DUF3500 domain-containing protein n=1 Tax=Blastococcus sp. KM273128 TaxID=2570314 RepID=UPI001F29BD38|nr:DUF3500 domain-containing protein [Blastococcus sp. KM273128]